MTKPTLDETGLAHLATEMMLASQITGVRLLEAEMQALAQMMPGAVQEPLPTEAEVEIGFDNMPI